METLRNLESPFVLWIQIDIYFLASTSYLPFAAGARACIGAGMAMLETQLVLAQIIQRFKVRVVPDHRIETVAKVTLKPRYGLPVTLNRR